MTYLSRGVLFEALGKLVCLDKGLRTSHCLTFCEARSSDELYILRADASNLELDLVLGVRFGVPSDTEGCSTLIYSDRPPPSALRPPLIHSATSCTSTFLASSICGNHSHDYRVLRSLLMTPMVPDHISAEALTGTSDQLCRHTF